MATTTHDPAAAPRTFKANRLADALEAVERAGTKLPDLDDLVSPSSWSDPKAPLPEATRNVWQAALDLINAVREDDEPMHHFPSFTCRRQVMNIIRKRRKERWELHIRVFTVLNDVEHALRNAAGKLTFKDEDTAEVLRGLMRQVEERKRAELAKRPPYGD
jgi:uncharacterized protein (DUF885 family)